ncbi:MAG: TIM-barrel domain-containing protein, partial [Gemmatimonadales bacterium]
MSGDRRRISRREAVRRIGGVTAGLAVPRGIFRGDRSPIVINGAPVEIAVATLSAATVRLTVLPIDQGAPRHLPVTGELADPTAGKEVARSRDNGALRMIRAGDLIVRFEGAPPGVIVERSSGAPVQRLVFDPSDPVIRFGLGAGPLLGLGEGGPQFDRRGAVDPMINGSDGYRLSTHGIRAPIQWLIGTEGWGLFIHEPKGAFDLSGREGLLTPHPSRLTPDVFIVATKDPRVMMREYARITGFAELPAFWTFGYQQSHRTLAGPEEVLSVAQTFRDKRLPCDALIYLGTDFCPSGWNTHNGEFTWNAANFPDPKAAIAALHERHFKVVLHSVIEGHHLIGTVRDRCPAPEPSGRTPDRTWPDERHVPCYWPYHEPAMQLGVDGWWPDQGDDYDVPSEINRHRMYWEGSQLVSPGERPYALHRNAAAGVQRYGGFIWSGDVQSRWETLKTHVAVAINAGLSGLPYWGTDIGGFIPTPEYTGELHVRWFQFGAFCPLFRAHGRNWHLRLPWGWDGGDGGPPESGRFRVNPEELHNA